MRLYIITIGAALLSACASFYYMPPVDTGSDVWRERIKAGK